MKFSRLILVGWIMISGFAAYAQRTVSEGTITYDIFIQSKNAGVKEYGGLSGSKSIIYLKGALSRTEMNSSLGNETTIHNGKTGSAAILKEYSGQKLMITLTKENWETRNKKFDGIIFENTVNTKVIDGYNCKQAVAKLKDGSTISVYYTPELIAMNKEYNQAFKNLAGFPMEYDFETEKLIFKYKLSKIDFSPVPASTFDFPKSGYRVMTFDENKKGKEK